MSLAYYFVCDLEPHYVRILYKSPPVYRLGGLWFGGRTVFLGFSDHREMFRNS